MADQTPDPELGDDADHAGHPNHAAEQIETDQTRAADALAEQNAGPTLPAGGGGILISPDPALRLAPLYAALAKAQSSFPEIPKDRVAIIRPRDGEKWKFKYSDLADLINATRPELTANGLAVFQIPSDDLKNCITTLAHTTGLTLVGNYPIKHKDGGRMHPGQDWAISWTFARRYGMSALLGIASEETVEGDKSEKTSDDFQSGSGDGILSVRGVMPPAGATKAEKAKLFSSAIEGKLNEAATEKGLEGVWERNAEVINTFQDHYRALHQNLLDVYKRCLDSIRERE